MQGIDDHTGPLRHIGEMLRDWRQRRHLNQRALAAAAGMSAHALGALEAGRLLPTRDTVLNLAERLEAPLRDRNAMLVAAGYEAAYPARRRGDPALSGIWAVVEQAVRGHAPYPALALDRHWGIVASNDVMHGLIDGIDPALLKAPVNWARVVLHPAGLAPRVANLSDWRTYVMNRLRRHFDRTGDSFVSDLLEELDDYPLSSAAKARHPPDPVAVPLRIVTVDGLLSFYSTTSVIGSAIDVTLAELTIEAFYPADAATDAIMHGRSVPPEAAD